MAIVLIVFIYTYLQGTLAGCQAYHANNQLKICSMNLSRLLIGSKIVKMKVDIFGPIKNLKFICM